MAISSASVKTTARSALKGKYVKAMVIAAVFTFSCFCCMLVSSIIANITALKYIYATVITVCITFLQLPLLLGTIRTFWHMFMGADVSPISVFYYFSSGALYDKALRVTLKLTLRFLVCAAIVAIPVIIIEAMSQPAVYERFGLEMPSFASNFWVLANFIKIVGGFIIVLITLRYYLVAFLLVADEEMEIAEAINMSRIISRSTAADFIMLILSFALYILASIFAIPLIFTIPYFIMAYLVHCRFAVARYNKFATEETDVFDIS